MRYERLRVVTATDCGDGWAVAGAVAWDNERVLETVGCKIDEMGDTARYFDLFAASPQLYKALADIVTYCRCVPRRADGSVQQDSRLLYELYQSAQAALLAANPEYSDVL